MTVTLMSTVTDTDRHETLERISFLSVGVIHGRGVLRQTVGPVNDRNEVPGRILYNLDYK